MPVYLCKPGLWSLEPWKHGIPVYSRPFRFPTEEETAVNPRESLIPKSIRRIKHSELVLVDDVQFSYGNYWLRLKWPGATGGFAGFICLMASQNTVKMNTTLNVTNDTAMNTSGNIIKNDANTVDDAIRQNNEDDDDNNNNEENLTVNNNNNNEDDVIINDDDDERNVEMDDEASAVGGPVAEEESREDAANTRKGEFIPIKKDKEHKEIMRCLRTGLVFPSSPELQLLVQYDDGLIPPVSLPIGNQPVFCRICRDGLHDTEDDDNNNNNNNEQTTQSTQQGTTGITNNAAANNLNAISNDNAANNDNDQMIVNNNNDLVLTTSKAAENPLMSPCGCHGSMAFVHYLCVEQWRCRSRHPGARNGTHCETCFYPYALPPPSSRPTPTHHGGVAGGIEEEWLEAMPPHVMQALRNPHLGWQLGAALVRKRWLRPLAPVLLSPLVALYCRARRLLKKRGVSRRRWACSLCRRRARWKCVRCLRSYYCSRQCQNVSWHIVHKHVCYKPSRVWWSCVVYGAIFLIALPGVLTDPLLYDLALSVIPPSFYIMAVLGGAMASSWKKLAGIDIRGRFLELTVLLLTCWLVRLTLGLVWAFFGAPNKCLGVFGRWYSPSRNLWSKHVVHKFLLTPGTTYFLFWDKLAYKYVRSIVCTSQYPGKCFPQLSQASSDTILQFSDCSSDLELLSGLWITAGMIILGGNLYRRHRQRMNNHNNNRRRPHQD